MCWILDLKMLIYVTIGNYAESVLLSPNTNYIALINFHRLDDTLQYLPAGIGY